MKVTIICPIYNSYPQIISALICQTYTNWKLLLVHDGPNSTNLKKLVAYTDDKRIHYWETAERKHNWGHHIRKECLEKMDQLSHNTDFVLITNPDNWYAPIYLEKMVGGFDKNTIACYPGAFVHGYLSPQPDGDYKFGTIETKLELGWIDCGCPLIRKKAACLVGWPSMEIYSDWDYLKGVIDRFGATSFKRIPGTLFVHC